MFLYIFFLYYVLLMPVAYALQETKGLSFENCVQHGKLIAPRGTAIEFHQLPGEGEIHKEIIRGALLNYLNEIPEGLKVQTTLRGHTNFIDSVAFSPDGNYLASGSQDKTIRVWDSLSGELLHTLSGHEIAVTTVAFSPDGKYLASSSHDRSVILWDPSSGRLIRTLSGHTDSVWGVAFGPDGKSLASASFDNSVRLWDPLSGQVLRTLLGHGNGVWAVAFSPDGKKLASGSWDTKILLWDPASGELLHTLSGHMSAVMALAFSPDGHLFASGSLDDTIRLWHVTSGRAVLSLGRTGEANSIAFSPDGKSLVLGFPDIQVLNLDSLNLSEHPAGGKCGSVAVSPDSKRFASASQVHRRGIVRLWTDYKNLLVPYFETLKGEKSYDQLLLALMVAQAKQENEPLYIIDLVEKVNERNSQSTTSIREWREILESMPPDVQSAFRKLFDLRVQRIRFA